MFLILGYSYAALYIAVIIILIVITFRRTRRINSRKNTKKKLIKRIERTKYSEDRFGPISADNECVICMCAF